MEVGACENGYGKRTAFGPGIASDEDDTQVDDSSSTSRYRRQHRGGKGVRDIKTTKRNGPVIGIARLYDDDELLMMTARGKLQRIAASDISVIGRNTQGVRIMKLDNNDKLAAIVRVPKEEATDGDTDSTVDENETASDEITDLQASPENESDVADTDNQES